jgi:hypothetical protein
MLQDNADPGGKQKGEADGKDCLDQPAVGNSGRVRRALPDRERPHEQVPAEIEQHDSERQQEEDAADDLQHALMLRLQPIPDQIDADMRIGDVAEADRQHEQDRVEIPFQLLQHDRTQDQKTPRDDVENGNQTEQHHYPGRGAADDGDDARKRH